MNSMYFTGEDVKAGLMTQLIDYLCKYSYESEPRGHAHYNDIHIRPDDCGAFVVEWVQAPWSGDYSGKFEYVGEEQVVCNEVEFPDKHFEYTPEDEDIVIKEWLEDNPGWYRDEWGHWHKKEEDVFNNVLTVKAIPVEWIEEYAETLSHFDEVIYDMLEDWEKENGNVK